MIELTLVDLNAARRRLLCARRPCPTFFLAAVVVVVVVVVVVEAEADADAEVSSRLPLPVTFAVAQDLPSSSENGVSTRNTLTKPSWHAVATMS